MNITPFNFEQQEIRTLVIEDNPWFVGKDVAIVLGYRNHTDALIRHVDEEDKDGVVIHDSMGREQKPTIINESGLYSLILRSKLESAKTFKRWVTSEVLPTLRKTGIYSIQQVPTNFLEALQLATRQEKEKIELQKQLIEAQPAIEFVEHSVKEGKTISFGEAAKILNLKTPDGRNIGRTLLKQGLRNMGVFMKQGKHDVPYQEHLNASRFSVKYTNVTIDGTEVPVPTTRVRPEGLMWIRRKFIKGGCTEA